MDSELDDVLKDIEWQIDYNEWLKEINDQHDLWEEENGDSKQDNIKSV